MKYFKFYLLTILVTWLRVDSNAQNASTTSGSSTGIITLNSNLLNSSGVEFYTIYRGPGNFGFSPMRLDFSYSPPSCSGANDENFSAANIYFNYSFAPLNSSSDGKYYIRFTTSFNQGSSGGNNIWPHLKVRINGNTPALDTVMSFPAPPSNSTGIANVVLNANDPILTVTNEIRISLWPYMSSFYTNGDLKPNGGRTECTPPAKWGSLTINNLTINGKCPDGSTRPDHIDYQNKTLPNYTSTIGYIRAGNSLNTAIPTGNVSIASGQYTNLEAGTNIQLLPGFSTPSGSVLTASIKNCGSYSARLENDNDNDDDGYGNQPVVNKSNNEGVSVYPVPAHDDLYIDTKQLINSVIVVNAQGGSVGVIVTGNHVVTSNLNPGVYTLLIDTEKGRTAKKFIVE